MPMDMIIVDPPRKGLGKELCELLIKKNVSELEEVLW